MKAWITVALLCAACGDDAPATGPQKLVPDPAVETGCAPRATPGAPRAKIVECADELVTSRLAGGRVGDFVLENERVRVIVRGPGAGLYLHGGSGGGIVDAVRINADGSTTEDLIKEVMPAVDLAPGAFDELVITEAGDDGPAEIVVRGRAAQLELIAAAGSREIPDVLIEHHYRLAAGATEVEMFTRAFPGEDASATRFDLYDAMFMGGRAPAFIPGRDTVEGQVSGEFVATYGTTTSYGLVYPDTSISLIDLAGIRLAQGGSIDGGERRALRYFVIGDGSVASITDRAWELRGTATSEYTVSATVPTDVVIRDAAQKPMTVARSGTPFRVPDGAYTAQTRKEGFVLGAATPLAAQTTAPMGASGTLAITVRDDGGTPLPARILIEAEGREARRVWTTTSGQLSVAVEPGTLRVSISRGVEYDAYIASAVVVAAGQTVPVDATLEHVIDTDGWISLDTHLHSEMSTDSTLPLDDRLRAVAGEGVDVAVSTDHDMITDYGPVITELGLGSWLTHLIGAEVSSLIWGHINGFPFNPRGDRTGNGAPSWLAKSPAQVFQAMHDTGDNALVQINHPRDGSSSLFNAIGFDAASGTASTSPSVLGLPSDTNLSDISGADAIEVANGSSEGDFERVFDDWLKLVRGGHRACATGSSDSHGAGAYAGEARTYVWVGTGNDAPGGYTIADIVTAIRARNVVVTTGAFVTASIDGAIPGETAPVTGTVPLRITVQAPPWRPLARIRIYQGAQEIQVITLDPQDTAPVRYDQTLSLPAPAADTFYVVRVDMSGSGAPVNDDGMASFTNPIFVDVP